MDFLDEGARDLLVGGRGARRAGHGARPLRPRRWSTERIKTAPSSFTLHAPEPGARPRDRRRLDGVRVGGERAERRDLDRGRRVGNHADYQNLIRLGQMLNCVHFFAGYPVEPIDLHAVDPPPRRDLRPADARRQADPRLQPRPAADHRRDGDGPDRPRHRRRDARPRAVALHGHQLVVAAPARHADAPRDPRVCRPATRSSCMTPFTLAGRDGAGDARRRARRAERRGAGRDGPHPGRPARRAGRSTAASPRTSTCSRARRRSGRPSTCGPR